MSDFLTLSDTMLKRLETRIHELNALITSSDPRSTQELSEDTMQIIKETEDKIRILRAQMDILYIQRGFI
jgi:hypothetical protein